VTENGTPRPDMVEALRPGATPNPQGNPAFPPDPVTQLTPEAEVLLTPDQLIQLRQEQEALAEEHDGEEEGDDGPV
ncbi:hypothetical protein LCGC14_1933190, partial [marine sediment metagenome]